MGATWEMSGSDSMLRCGKRVFAEHDRTRRFRSRAHPVAPRELKARANWIRASSIAQIHVLGSEIL
jgi:hypothetical protein